MKIRAAILSTPGAPLSVEAVEIDPPGTGEVLVQLKGAGVCHSDLHAAAGDWPMRTPVVLGHEGTGVVREIGPSVTALAPGDDVVFCWAPGCGECPSCAAGRAALCDQLDRTAYRNRLATGASRMKRSGQRVHPFLGIGCFADAVVVAERSAVRVPPGLPFDALATVGCAVVTGVGAFHAAGVPHGGRVAVIGAGGVGLNVIQAARIAGCEQIIAVDRHTAPLARAGLFGATDIIQAPLGLADGVRQLTGGRGVDAIFDTVSTRATLTEALGAVRKGGTVVMTGLSRADARAELELFPFVLQGKQIIGSVYGSGDPAADITRLIQWFEDGRLKLKELVGRSYGLSDINLALEALSTGQGARGIITWPQ